MTSVSDNFDRADANPAGGNWTVPTGAGAVQISSNELKGTTGDCLGYWNANTFANDQYAIAQEPATGQDAGPAVRVGASSRNAYVYNIHYRQIFKFVSNSWILLQSNLETTASANTDYKIDVTGTTIKVYKAGTQIGTNQTDSSLSSGQPGVFAYGADRLNNWSAADASTAYTLTCSAGSYTITGVSATLNKSFELTCNAGSYTLTGVSAGLNKGFDLTCSAGSYTLTGASAELNKGFDLTCSAGSYTITGASADLTKTAASTYDLICQAGSYTVTGVSAELSKGFDLTCNTGEYNLAGVSANLVYTPISAPVTGGGGGYRNGLVSHRDDHVPRKRKKVEDKEESVKEFLLKVLEPEKKTVLLPTAVETTVEEIDYSLYLMLLAA